MDRAARILPGAVLALLLWLAALTAWAMAQEPPLPPDQSDAYANSQRAEGWRADLLVLATQLPEKHPNLFAKISEQEWTAAVDRLGAAIPQLSDAQVVTQLAQLINLAGDANTQLELGPEAGFNFYPLGLYWFEDGLYVVQGPAELAELLGAKLTAIDGVPTAEVLLRLAPAVPHANESQLHSQAPYFIVLAELLHALGVADAADSARFELTLQDGRAGAIELTPQRPARGTQYAQLLDPATPRPYYMHQPDKPYFSEWLPLSNTLYTAYNASRESAELSPAQFLQQVLDGLAGLPEAKLVLDLRVKRGSDAAWLDDLSAKLAARPEFAQPGRLFVLIGRNTSGAALISALRLKREAAALFVGEPSGGSPSHFGAVESFTLPISGLRVQYSTQYFDSGDPAAALTPDVLVPETLADYVAGRDAAVAAAVAWQP